MAKELGAGACARGEGMSGALLRTGLVSCLAALFMQIFPTAAAAAEIDLGATWRLFAFGLFLISVGAFVDASERAARARPVPPSSDPGTSRR